MCRDTTRWEWEPITHGEALRLVDRWYGKTHFDVRGGLLHRMRLDPSVQPARGLQSLRYRAALAKAKGE